jgi:type VI protein secretion system component Hcp
MNRTKSAAAVIYLAAVACGSLLAQTSNPPPKGSTKVFGLPVSKSDNGKDAPAAKGETAASVESRSEASGSKSTPAADTRSQLGAISRVYLTIEGARQGKFKGTLQRGKDGGIECLRYVLQPAGNQPATGRSKPSMTITKESDASGQLQQALETGEPLKTVTLEFVEGEGSAGGKVVSRAELTGASIVSIEQHFDAKTRGAFEDVILNFSKIEFKN